MAWALLGNDFKEVRDKHNQLLYRYKSCIDKFPYKVEHDGQEVVIMLTEKRLVTYNPALAAKKRYEIKRMAEKAKSLTLSQAKRIDYGEAAKYVDFIIKKAGRQG